MFKNLVLSWDVRHKLVRVWTLRATRGGLPPTGTWTTQGHAGSFLLERTICVFILFILISVFVQCLSSLFVLRERNCPCTSFKTELKGI